MDEPARQTSERVRIGIAVILVVTFIAYIPVLGGGWLWDDDVHVTHNPGLRDFAGLVRLWVSVGVTPQYYPLTHTSFWIQYQIWGAGSTLPYQLANIALHVASSLLLWLILHRLGLKFAWLAAAIFALHPVHVESVAWVTERKNTLSGFFYLVGAVCLLRAMDRERMDWRWYAGGALAFVAALFSKTVAASLPAAMLLVLFWKQGGRLKRWQILSMIPLLAAGAGMGSLTAWMEEHHVGASGTEFEFSLLKRFQIAGTAAWFYVMKLLVPIRQSFIYWRWDVKSWGPAWYLMPLSAAIVLAGLFAMRKRLGAGPLVAMLFFGGTVFPALGFANLYPTRYTFVADHFQYLASIGVIVLMAAVLSRAGKLAWVILPVLGVLTSFRAWDFRDEVALWEDTLVKNPRAWIAHDQLGSKALEQGDFRTALEHFSLAVEIEPNHIEGFMGLSNAYRFLGAPGPAVEAMKRAVELEPDKAVTHFSLGMTLAAVADFNGAIAAFEEAIKVDPKFPPAHLKLAEVYDFLGKPELAAPHRAEGERLARDWMGGGTPPTTR